MSWIRRMDKVNKFFEVFNTKTGFYMRSGILDENMKDTGIDAFARDYPQLLDIGIMGTCIHGKSGLCIKSGVECYQNGLNIHKANMGLENFKKIIDESKGKVFQVALGGRGDVDMHENFEEILQYCVDNNIVPNFTTSGLGLTPEKVNIIKKYCGAIAISYYRQHYTYKAINMLLEAGVKTNIHYVLGNNSIDEAINKLENDSFQKGINAVIFLLHKPVGMGSQENVLKIDDLRVKKFYSLINNTYSHKIGFDSCNMANLVNFNSTIDHTFTDACESSRMSLYIDAEMNAMVCSFDNEEKRWSLSLNDYTLEEVWNSDKFENFRNSFRNSCPSCKDRINCLGGCPIKREITLCDRLERK